MALFRSLPRYGIRKFAFPASLPDRKFHLGVANPSGSKLDELLPKVVDFPARHIGPRKHEAKDMLNEIGYAVEDIRSGEMHQTILKHFRCSPLTN